MSSLLRLLKNVFSLLTTELVNIAIRVVFTAFLVRYLSVSDFGIYLIRKTVNYCQYAMQMASQEAVFLTNFQPISDLILTFFLYN